MSGSFTDRNKRVERLRGMDDVLPPASYPLREAAARLSAAVEGRGYRLVDVPLFEYTELFLRKAGEALAPRLYAFSHRGRDICARPEFTASVGRLYVEQLQDAPLPQRLYYHGPVLRYEKPGRGRRRQFTQFGLELIGAAGALADAEIILTACEGLEALGVRDYRIVLGHIGTTLDLLEHLKLDRRARSFVLGNLENLGRPDRGMDYVQGRLAELYPSQGQPRTPAAAGVQSEEGREVLMALLGRLNADMALGSRSVEEVVEGVLNQLARPDPVPLIRRALELAQELQRLSGPPDEAFPAAAGLLEKYHLRQEPLHELEQLVHILRGAGLPKDALHVDLGFGRGLYYYTGMIFEIYADDGDGNTHQLCGGGRYDDLIAALGGRRRTPACGLAFGLERLLACSELEGEGPSVDILISTEGAPAMAAALDASRRLRGLGLAVELEVRGRSASACRAYAARRGIRWCVRAHFEGEESGFQIVESVSGLEEHVAGSEELVGWMHRHMRGDEE